MDGMKTRRTLTAICKKSDEAKCPSRYCARREALATPHVDASIDPWCVIQGVNPPPVRFGSKEGFRRLMLFADYIRG